MQWLNNSDSIQLCENLYWPKPCSNALSPVQIAQMASAIFPRSIVTGKIALALWGILLPSDCEKGEQVDCLCLTVEQSDISIVRNEVGLFRCYPVEEAKGVCMLPCSGSNPVSFDGPRSALGYTLKYQRGNLSSELLRRCASALKANRSNV